MAPTTIQQLSRPSVDSLYDLVKDLDENQIHDLLHELNSSAEGNIEVAKAIDMFEVPTSPRFSRPPCLDLDPASPPQLPDWPRNRPITWRQSRRISSVPLNFALPPNDSMPSKRISSVPLQLMHPQTEPIPSRERAMSGSQLLETISPTEAEAMSYPEPELPRPRTSNGDERPSMTNRSYRRISRPMFLMPGSHTQGLADQLSAYFHNEPIAESIAPSTPGLSPTSPGSMSSDFSLGMSIFDDLREPVTPRSAHVFGRPEKPVPISMSGIFEVLRDN